MYTLVIIDMQERFVQPHQTRVVNNCIREIEQAKEDLAPIIFVEYSGCGPTMPQLQKAVTGYARLHQVTKYSDDGGREVAEALRGLGLSHQPLKVVGVNTDCCVYRTLQGLTAHLPNTTLEVVADACDSDWKHIDGLVNIHKMGIKLLNQRMTTDSLGNPVLVM